MTLRFIHTADWQIGKPFRNFPAALAGELAAARLDAIGRIAAVARARHAPHVLVAGDVFDSEHLPALELRRTLERLAAERDIEWLLLPGNHDCARTGGLWDRIRAIGLPANVAAVTEPKPHPLGPAAIVLPAPLNSKNPGTDLTAWMDDATTPPGIARIGLAHGSVQGFGSQGESAVALAKDRAARAGLAYLALGDWHGTRAISADTWYSGTPEPDRFPDNEPGNVLAVTIEGTHLTSVDKIATAAFHWHKLSAAISGAADLALIERDIASRAATQHTVLIELTLSGSVSLADRATLSQWCERMHGRLRHLTVDDEALAVRPDGDDLAIFAGCPALGRAAERLAREAAGDDEAAAIAARALQRLHGFAAEQLSREGK